jgi:hypothetical protein
MDIGCDQSTPRGNEEIFESIPDQRRPPGPAISRDIMKPDPAIETTSIDPISAFEVFQGKLYINSGSFISVSIVMAYFRI